MRVISLNVNGLRAATRKGFFRWLRRQHADIVCLQEARTQESQCMFLPRYHCHYYHAEKKGYSGVALYTRERPDEVVRGFGWSEADIQARYLEARFKGLSVASVYVPSGSASDARQQAKLAFLERFMCHLKGLASEQRHYILCGDWIIAHRPIDLRNWRANQKRSGFLPAERNWMDELFGRAGFVDAFRVVHQSPEQYTWWSNRGRAWEHNVGWRLDYHVVSAELAPAVRAASIFKRKRFSDHAPLVIDYADLPLPAVDSRAATAQAIDRYLAE